MAEIKESATSVAECLEETTSKRMLVLGRAYLRHGNLEKGKRLIEKAGEELIAEDYAVCGRSLAPDDHYYVVCWSHVMNHAKYGAEAVERVGKRLEEILENHHYGEIDLYCEALVKNPQGEKFLRDLIVRELDHKNLEIALLLAKATRNLKLIQECVDVCIREATNDNVPLEKQLAWPGVLKHTAEVYRIRINSEDLEKWMNQHLDDRPDLVEEAADLIVLTTNNKCQQA